MRYLNSISRHLLSRLPTWPRRPIPTHSPCPRQRGAPKVDVGGRGDTAPVGSDLSDLPTYSIRPSVIPYSPSDLFGGVPSHPLRPMPERKGKEIYETKKASSANWAFPLSFNASRLEQGSPFPTRHCLLDSRESSPGAPYFRPIAPVTAHGPYRVAVRTGKVVGRN